MRGRPSAHARRMRSPPVAQISNLPGFPFYAAAVLLVRPAGWKPATRQTGSLRYGSAAALLRGPRGENRTPRGMPRCDTVPPERDQPALRVETLLFRISEFGIRISFGPSLPRSLGFLRYGFAGGAAVSSSGSSWSSSSLNRSMASSMGFGVVMSTPASLSMSRA